MFEGRDKLEKRVSSLSLLLCQSRCSPYQALTGKIYRLKQHFLPPATAGRVIKFNK